MQSLPERDHYKIKLDRKVAFITYETPFAPGGGIAAVMSHLPQSLQELSKIPTFVISPYHINISKTTDLKSELVTIETIRIRFDHDYFDLDIQILERAISWVFIKPHLKLHQKLPFFAGKRHPYDVEKETSKNQSVLLRDALFFGKAVSSALPKLDPKSSWTLLMQDWEAATTSLAFSKGTNPSFKFSPYLTLHNSYDSGLADQDLSIIGLDPENFPGDTVLQCALPLMLNPVFTVSEQFALDLSRELLQTEIMVPHIGEKLTPRLLGVNNGPFVENLVPERVIISAQEGDNTQFQRWKTENRTDAYNAMDNIKPSARTPIWGDLQKFDRTEAPWYLMAGRDDSRQKGYELACIAIDQYLSNGGQGRFLFFPIPGDEGLGGINFINDLAHQYPQYVLGFPFLFREGFFAVMRGANFGVMPSYYEPFGMANEFYLNGVGCIGRATGGITQQIVPHRQIPSFTPSVKHRADHWHLPDSSPTGFLFRERDGIPSALDDWLSINEADYKLTSGKSGRLSQRKELQTIKSMASELRTCLEDTTEIYLSQQDLYYKMLIDGLSYITSNFSWETTARIYLDNILDITLDKGEREAII